MSLRGEKKPTTLSSGTAANTALPVFQQLNVFWRHYYLAFGDRDLLNIYYVALALVGLVRLCNPAWFSGEGEVS